MQKNSQKDFTMKIIKTFQTRKSATNFTNKFRKTINKHIFPKNWEIDFAHESIKTFREQIQHHNIQKYSQHIFQHTSQNNCTQYFAYKFYKIIKDFINKDIKEYTKQIRKLFHKRIYKKKNPQ